MPVICGQGQSDCTIRKQKALRYLLSVWIPAVYGVAKGRFPARPEFHFIDAFAGSGYNAEALVEGSPLVFMEEIVRGGGPYCAWFIEKNPESAAALRRRIPPEYVMEGDNAAVLPFLAQQLKVPRGGLDRLGLLYLDPNSSVKVNVEAVNTLITTPGFHRLDVLVNVNACAHKRSLGAGNEHPSVAELLTRIEKRYQFIQQPARGDDHQFAFALLTNWAGAPVLRHEGFQSIDSAIGQEILERLNYTPKQRQERVQLAFPDPATPYASYAEYLRTPEFLAVRREVMDRSGGWCEKCGRRRATEPHHLKYPPWGSFDVPENLVAVCHECHCEIHGKER